MNKENEYEKYFLDHVIVMIFKLSGHERSYHYLVTSFLFTVLEYSFIVTAGHCINELSKILNMGYKLINCHIVDYLGSNPTNFSPIPFNFSFSNSYVIRPDGDDSDELSFDYSFIPLSQYYKQLLEKNNLRFLDEKVWKLQPKEEDFYMLFGIPSELTNETEKEIHIQPKSFIIEKDDSIPINIPKGKNNQFYGKIKLNNEINDIKGMSGGPIFSFHIDQNGDMKYWLKAIQSRWLPDSKIVIGCPMKFLGDQIEQLIYKVQSSTDTE